MCVSGRTVLTNEILWDSSKVLIRAQDSFSVPLVNGLVLCILIGLKTS